MPELFRQSSNRFTPPAHGVEGMRPRGLYSLVGRNEELGTEDHRGEDFRMALPIVISITERSFPISSFGRKRCFGGFGGLPGSAELHSASGSAAGDSAMGGTAGKAEGGLQIHAPRGGRQKPWVVRLAWAKMAFAAQPSIPRGKDAPPTFCRSVPRCRRPVFSKTGTTCPRSWNSEGGGTANPEPKFVQFVSPKTTVLCAARPALCPVLRLAPCAPPRIFPRKTPNFTLRNDRIPR